MEFTHPSDGVRRELGRVPAAEALGAALVPALFKPGHHSSLQSTGVRISFLLK